MSTYSFTLFVHIIAAVGVFVSLGLEWTGLRQLRRSTTDEQRGAWFRLAGGSGRIGMPSMLLAVLTGFFMARDSWHRLAWLETAVATLVVMIAIGLTISRPRMAAIARAISTNSANLASIAADPALALSVQMRAALTAGIVFLMTVKPDLRQSVFAIVLAAIFGIAFAAFERVPMSRDTRNLGRAR